ncbi:MAG: hypothetical protein ACTHZ1_13520 [Sphingobacterium sp.]
MIFLKEKFKQINLFALLALFVVGGLALELKAQANSDYQATKTYRPIYDDEQNLQGWDPVEPNADYNCVGAQNVCTAEFLESETPTPATPPLSTVEGNFTPIP